LVIVRLDRVTARLGGVMVRLDRVMVSLGRVMVRLDRVMMRLCRVMVRFDVGTRPSVGVVHLKRATDWLHV
jgi:hypothetical protein